MSSRLPQTDQRAAAQWRAQAHTLLEGLLDVSRRSNARLTEQGRSDVMRDLTGHSAIDQAIVELRVMIASTDEMLQPADALSMVETKALNGNGQVRAGTP